MEGREIERWRHCGDSSVCSHWCPWKCRIQILRWDQQQLLHPCSVTTSERYQSPAESAVWVRYADPVQTIFTQINDGKKIIFLSRLWNIWGEKLYQFRSTGENDPSSGRSVIHTLNHGFHRTAHAKITRNKWQPQTQCWIKKYIRNQNQRPNCSSKNQSFLVNLESPKVKNPENSRNQNPIAENVN